MGDLVYTHYIQHALSVRTRGFQQSQTGLLQRCRGSRSQIEIWPAHSSRWHLWVDGTIACPIPDDGCLTRFYVVRKHSNPMSSQPSHSSGIESRTLSCTFCGCRLTERLLALQCYPSEATSVPAGVPDDGGLTICPECASEVIELLTSWHPHEEPPIRADAAIGDAYQAVASTCSFCADSEPQAGLGIELYRRVGDELPAYATYTLCEPC